MVHNLVKRFRESRKLYVARDQATDENLMTVMFGASGGTASKTTTSGDRVVYQYQK